MALWQWSTTPANNANVGNIDWAPNMPPSAVNPSARQMMADVAVQFANGWEWLQYGDTPSYISTTQFSVPGNLTSRYTVGRRIKTYNTGGTFYGTISASAYTSLTTVTVTLDSGSLDSGLSEIDVGILNPAFSSLGTLTLNEPGNGYKTLTINAPNGTDGANIFLAGNGATTPNKILQATNGQFNIVNNAVNAAILQLTDSGNLTVAGNVTAYSDERLKKDWQPLQDDFIERLAALKRGIFTRIDSGERQVGVGAQSLRAFMPEAVQGDDILSVAYGQVALVAVAELAAEVLRLRALWEPLK
jgi:hypothetical protein